MVGADPRHPVAGKDGLDLFEQQARQALRLRDVDLVEHLGPRHLGSFDRAPIVVNGDERPRVERSGDCRPLTDGHVEVASPRQGHRVPHFLEGQLRMERHYEVQVSLDKAVGPHRTGLGATVTGIKHHVYWRCCVDGNTVLVDDLTATRATYHRRAGEPAHYGKQHFVGALHDPRLSRAAAPIADSTRWHGTCQEGHGGHDRQHGDAERGSTGHGVTLGDWLPDAVRPRPKPGSYRAW